MKYLSIIILSCLACALFTDSAAAQTPPYTFFPDDKVVDKPQVARDSIVGFKQLKDGFFDVPSSPVIDLVAGGVFTRPVFLFNNSTLNINGGSANTTTRGVIADDDTRVNIIAGTVRGVEGYDTSRITMSGGEITGGITLEGTSQAVVSGGNVMGGLSASFGSTIVTLSGGTVGSLTAGNGGTATMTGGRVRQGVGTGNFGTNTINLIDADVGGQLHATGPNSTVTLFDGNVGSDAFASDRGTLNLNGGTIGGSLRTSSASDNGRINLSGASIGGSAHAANGTIKVFSGTIGGSLTASGDNGTAIMIGGTVNGGASASGRGVILLQGGRLSGGLLANDRSAIDIAFEMVVEGTVLSQHSSTLDMDGGRIAGSLQARGGPVTVSGGEISLGILSANSSTVALSGGVVGGLEVSNSSSLVMTGGTVSGDVYTYNSGKASFGQGFVGGSVSARGGSGVALFGAAVASFAYAEESSTLVMDGGNVGRDLGAFDNGTVGLFGGVIAGNLLGGGNGTVFMTGGFVTGRDIFGDNSRLVRSGGAFGRESIPTVSADLHALSGKTSGASANDPGENGLVFRGNSGLELIGNNLQTTLVDPNYQGMFSAYRLSGSLADGTDITGEMIYLENATGADFELMAIPEPTPWRPDADGKWSDLKSWYGPVPNGVGATARFLERIKQDRVVNVDGSFTVGRIIFDNPLASYRIESSSFSNRLTIAGDQPRIEVVSGAHTITTQLDLTGETEIAVAQDSSLSLEYFDIPSAVAVNKTGPGALNAIGFQFTGPNASLDVRQGTVNADELFGYRGVAGVTERHVGKVKVGPGATLVTGLARLTELAVPGGSAIIRQSGPGPDNPSNDSTGVLQNLSLGETPESSAATGKLDINNNKLIIAAETPEKVALLRRQLMAGRNVLPGGAADANWNGSVGIISSSAAAANLASGSESRSIGYVVNGANATVNFASFGGQPVQEGDLLIRYTRNADFNLDGVVNDNDVSIAGGFYDPGRDPNGPEGPRHWFQGDSNYNGIVDDNDISVLGGFYLPGATPIAGAEGRGFAAVPEPGMLGMIAVCAVVRRRVRGRDVVAA